MSGNGGSETETALTVECEEIIIEEIATEIIHDIILEFCFEMHRAVKLRYIESLFTNENNKHCQKLNSFGGKFQERKICNLNKSSKGREYNVSGQQTISTEKRGNEEIIAEYYLSYKTDVSVKNSIIIDSFSSKCKGYGSGSEFLQVSKKAKRNKIIFSDTKARFSKNMDNSNCNLSNNCNIVHIPHPKLRESEIVSPIMNSFPDGNGIVQNIAVRKFNNKYLKLSMEGIQQTSNLVLYDELTKSLVFQGYGREFRLEKSLIKEAFDCSACTNSKSFQDWLKFFVSTEVKESNNIKEIECKDILSDKEIKRCLVLVKEEQVETYIFDTREKFSEKLIKKMTCTCTICKRKVGAVRFASHLGTCMGLGRRRSQRIYSNAKSHKVF